MSVCAGDPQKVCSSLAHNSLRTTASASAKVGKLLSVVPGRPPNSTTRPCHVAMGEQSDHREQPHKRRCGPAYRQIRPLTLRLESQMSAYLLEGHFQLPTRDEPREDLLRIGVEIGTQKGLGLELSLWVMDHNPAHGHGEQSRGVPHGCPGSDLDHTLAFTVPVGDRGWLPNGVRVLGDLGKVGQALALYARSSYLARFAWRSRLVECGVQPKTGDEGDRFSQPATAIEELQGSVGAIGYGHYLSFRVPAPH